MRIEDRHDSKDHRVSRLPTTRALFEELEGAWRKSTDWAFRTSRACKLDKQVPDPYLRELLWLGFARAAFNTEYHSADRLYGTGAPLSENVFSVVEKLFEERKRQLADFQMGRINTPNPLRAYKMHQEELGIFQNGVFEETARMFEVFYVREQLGGYTSKQFQDQVEKSMGSIFESWNRFLVTAQTLN